MVCNRSDLCEDAIRRYNAGYLIHMLTVLRSTVVVAGICVWRILQRDPKVAEFKESIIHRPGLSRSQHSACLLMHAVQYTHRLSRSPHANRTPCIDPRLNDLNSCYTVPRVATNSLTSASTRGSNLGPQIYPDTSEGDTTEQEIVTYI